jgi:hypothetical protein
MAPEHHIPILSPDHELVAAAARAELEWTASVRPDALDRARQLRAEVKRRGLGAEVVRALEAPRRGSSRPPRPGPTVQLVRTPYGALPSLVAADLREPERAPESCPEVDPADVLSIEPAP